MSPKEIAKRLRDLALEHHGYLVARDLVKLANELDPSKPQRLKPGTVVRFVNGTLGIADKNGIHWVGSGEHTVITLWKHEAAHRWKPVHILADDEVAVKRSELLKLANGERLLEENAYDSGEMRE